MRRRDEEKNMTGKSKTLFRHLMLCSAAFVLATGSAAVPARAQDATAATQAQPQYQAPSDQKLSQGQLDQLVAPIALYPDPLLTQVLMASTYPLEVVEAARWSHDNPGVTGNALQDAMQAQSWDPSVKALTAVPQTLQMMSDKLDWTQQLGDAFLAQQQDVMNAVQNLRAQAQAAGNLQSTPQQRVTTAQAPQGAASTSMQQAIVIEPTNPDVYYVPVYNPAVAYGNWDYPAYPPFYWSPAGFVASNVVSFAAGVAVGAAIWGSCDWWGHNVIINVNRFNAFNHTNIANNVWIHNPANRDGVPYRNAAVAARFDRADTIANRDALRDRLNAANPEMSRTWDGVADAARTVEPERRIPDVARDAGRIPDIARDAERQPDRVTMPSREFDRPMADALAQDMRGRAPEFHMPERSFGSEGGGFFSHFGGGRRRF
jgi:hypothetical protein